MNCKQCQSPFSVAPEDREFYGKMNVPEPKLCQNCRAQRRMASRNEINLYRRTCDKCNKSIISCYSVNNPLTIWCNKCWYSDDFDPYKYGRDFDFNRPFFEQFSELEKSIPHFALFQAGENENCEYTNYGVGNKSCYMAIVVYCENVHHSYLAVKSTNCIDTTKVQNSELCYECVDCMNCSRLLFSQNCHDCHESMFLINSNNNKNCFGSINLNHKEYVFLNKQLTKEEYKKRMAEIKLDNQKIREMQSYIKKLSRQSIHRYYTGVNNENSTGDFIDNCKNCKECFDVLYMENGSYMQNGGGANDLSDCTNSGVGSSFSYQMNGITQANNSIGVLYGRDMNDCYYSHICFNSHDLIGCFGIHHGEYVILNKKYSKEEYENLKTKIIEHMKKNGEWGEFFPVQNSPFGYNESMAMEHFPLTKEEVLNRGWKWKEQDEKIQKHEETDAIKKCGECKTSFLIIEQVQKFYDKFDLPQPDRCPMCRHKRRFSLRNPRTLFDRNCDKCNTGIQTTFAPDRPEKVYCEQCYLKEVY